MVTRDDAQRRSLRRRAPVLASEERTRPPKAEGSSAVARDHQPKPREPARRDERSGRRAGNARAMARADRATARLSCGLARAAAPGRPSGSIRWSAVRLILFWR